MKKIFSFFKKQPWKVWLNSLLILSSLIGYTIAISFFVNRRFAWDYNTIINILPLILASSLILIFTLGFALLETKDIISSIKPEEKNDPFQNLIKVIEDRKQRLMLVATSCLIIGLIFALLGLGIPPFLFHSTELTSDTKKQFYLGLIGKSSYIALFISLAFFFFRMYKSIKEDINFLVRAHLNVLSKAEIIKLLKENNKIDDKDLLLRVIDNCMNTDKNHKG